MNPTTSHPHSTLSLLHAEWSADPEQAFADGITMAFDRWTALAVAVDNQLAGPDTDAYKEEFIDSLIEIFVNHEEENRTHRVAPNATTAASKIYPEDIEDWLQDTLSETFHITAEDDSIHEMAKLCCQLWHDCVIENDFTGVQRMVLSQRNTLDPSGRRQVADVVRSDASTDDSDEDDESEQEPHEEPSATSSSISTPSHQRCTMAEFAALQQHRQQASTTSQHSMLKISGGSEVEPDNSGDGEWHTVPSRRNKR